MDQYHDVVCGREIKYQRSQDVHDYKPVGPHRWRILVNGEAIDGISTQLFESLGRARNFAHQQFVEE